NIPQMTKMHGNLKQEEHSQIQQICPGQAKIINKRPPYRENYQAVKNKQDDMQSRNWFERLNLFLVLRGQLKTSLKLEMPDLAKPTRRINGQIIITDIKNDP